MSHIPLDFRAHRSTVAAVAMLTFNVILRAYGYDPAEVCLVRHALTGRSTDGVSHQERLTSLWRDDPVGFELYQRRQPKPIYGDRRLVAVFLGQSRSRTVFAGFWRVDAVSRDAAVTCPVTGQTGVEVNLYGMTRLDTLRQLEGRLRIDWGRSTRQWWQVASQQDKAIVAIADEPAPPFPGWSTFKIGIDGLGALPDGWRSILAAARGVYLLVLRRNGQQYIGSAIGAGGFLGRWASYAADGHGGNVMLRGNKPEDYDVCVIEAASSSATDADILALETAWKAKLGSRTFGLNAN